MGGRLARKISSRETFVSVPDEAWAAVHHGGSIELSGEILIFDLIMLQDAAQHSMVLGKKVGGNFRRVAMVIGSPAV